jgi:hypothetical protein
MSQLFRGKEAETKHPSYRATHLRWHFSDIRTKRTSTEKEGGGKNGREGGRESGRGGSRHRPGPLPYLHAVPSTLFTFSPAK